MGQVALQRSTVDLDAAAPALRSAHARFLKHNRDVLVTFGPIFTAGGKPAGYVYQTDFPGTTADAMTPFLADDPFGREGIYTSSVVSGWKCALAHRQPTMPLRPNLQGFFFHGIAVPNATARRNAIVEAHRDHLIPKDDSNCVSRGPLTDATGGRWLGSAMVYEFADRAALDAFFRNEPYCVNGIYQTIDIYDWRRGEMA